jgi:site-specific recombinase XerD
MHELMSIQDSTPILLEGTAVQQQTWLQAWLAYLPDAQFSPATIDSYRKSAREWAGYLLSQQVTQPNPTTFAAWITFLLKTRGFSQGSMATYTSAIKSFYRWTESRNLYPNISRSARIPVKKRTTPLPCPTPDQIREMLQTLPKDAPGSLRTIALIQVMYSCALRCVSLQRAKLRDLDLEQGILRHQSKGHIDKDSVAILSGTAKAALREYLNTRPDAKPDSPLFLSIRRNRSGKGLHSSAMRAIVLHLAESVGLVSRSTQTKKVIGRGHFSAHSIRRASITRVYDQFGLHEAQTFAGHASSDTTRQAYARVKAHEMLQKLSGAMDL